LANYAVQPGARVVWCLKRRATDVRCVVLPNGVPVEVHVIPGAFHGFGAAGGSAPQVQDLVRLRDAALARAFQA